MNTLLLTLTIIQVCTQTGANFFFANQTALDQPFKIKGETRPGVFPVPLGTKFELGQTVDRHQPFKKLASSSHFRPILRSNKPVLASTERSLKVLTSHKLLVKELNVALAGKASMSPIFKVKGKLHYQKIKKSTGTSIYFFLHEKATFEQQSLKNDPELSKAGLVEAKRISTMKSVSKALNEFRLLFGTDYVKSVTRAYSIVIVIEARFHRQSELSLAEGSLKAAFNVLQGKVNLASKVENQLKSHGAQISVSIFASGNNTKNANASLGSIANAWNNHKQESRLGQFIAQQKSNLPQYENATLIELTCSPLLAVAGIRRHFPLLRDLKVASLRDLERVYEFQDRLQLIDSDLVAVKTDYNSSPELFKPNFSVSDFARAERLISDHKIQSDRILKRLRYAVSSQAKLNSKEEDFLENALNFWNPFNQYYKLKILDELTIFTRHSVSRNRISHGRFMHTLHYIPRLPTDLERYWKTITFICKRKGHPDQKYKLTKENLNRYIKYLNQGLDSHLYLAFSKRFLKNEAHTLEAAVQELTRPLKAIINARLNTQKRTWTIQLNLLSPNGLRHELNKSVSVEISQH